MCLGGDITFKMRQLFSNSGILSRGFSYGFSYGFSELRFRQIFSQTGEWPQYLQATHLTDVEKYWKEKISQQDEKTRKTPNKGKNSKYILSMFPYPSGHLHMGHVRVYTIGDVMTRYYKFKQDSSVFQPMGFDSFGLPAENAALKHGIHPKEWTSKNIQSMKTQLEPLGLDLDWSGGINTSDPSYYKWTQWIFLKLLEKGLAYKGTSLVNWDPVDKTVLADEQVDENGLSWRSGAQVEKKSLEQWFIKTTDYAEELYHGLDDLEDWREIENIQKSWIGICDGVRLKFKIHNTDENLKVWTNKPELLYGLCFVGVTKDHPLLNGDESKKISVVHPLTGDIIPVFVVHDSELYPRGSDSFLGIPDVHERISDICKLRQIPIKTVLTDGGNKLINSDNYSNLLLPEAREKILERTSGIGGDKLTSSNLRDWLISRQRYWGTPIPVINCDNCGSIPVPERDLPVTLPDDIDFNNLHKSESNLSPLSQCHEWINVDCPNCGNPAVRETDTMDTFVDSSWYFLRYLDPDNEQLPVSYEASKAMPVDIYVGGKEHATLHLLYARFMTRFLHDLGICSVKEPFRKLLVQGLVMGQSYREKGSSVNYTHPDNVETVQDGNKKIFKDKNTGNVLVAQWEKMSKSKLNGVNPGDIFDKYGGDMTRFLIMADVSPYTDRKWTEDSFVRIEGLQIKMWKLIYQSFTLPIKNIPPINDELMKEQFDKLFDARNYYTKQLNFAYDVSRNFNTIIAKIHGLVNDLWTTHGYAKVNCPEYTHALGTSIILLAPMAPNFCSELWAGFQHSFKNSKCDKFDWNKSLFEQKWPELDLNYNIKVKVMHNDKDLLEFPVALWKFRELTEEEAVNISYCEPLVQDNVLSKPQFKYTFNKQEDFGAILNFTTPISKEERINVKQAKKQAKELRKLRKEQTKMKFASSTNES